MKSQIGGTCWTHGVMAAMESNLMITGGWAAAGDTGEPNLAEYHLDWWNGFNQFYNSDLVPPYDCGLMVHEGGDYLVATAYLARGDGAVRDIDGQSYNMAAPLLLPGYRRYFPQQALWLTTESALRGRERIKRALMEHGAVGTCMAYNWQFMGPGYVHYQPDTSQMEPNHAVAIVGWDDQLASQAPQPGAWLCKNSWGSGWGNQGYFWISYEDKHCARHSEMGAVQYRGIKQFNYDRVYSYDYHGWRDAREGCSQALNLFRAEARGRLEAVGFYITVDSVNYTVAVYDYFDQGGPSGLRASVTGFCPDRGFRVIQLDKAVDLWPRHEFAIALWVSRGGQALDRTSEVPVLLGSKSRALVRSSARPGQSYFREAGVWSDLYSVDSTANFCIKGFARDSVQEALSPARTSVARPNPFGSKLLVETFLQAPGEIITAIYDIAGRRLRTMRKESPSAGWQVCQWDGRGDEGSMLPAGIYLLRIEADARVDNLRVIKIR